MMDWIFGRYSAISYSLLIALTAGGLFLIGAASVVGLVISLIFFGIFLFGVYEHQQKGSGIRANFPILAQARFFFESFRPELRQYFWEDDDDEVPYSRNQRDMVYQRARGELAARPLGTIKDVYEEDYDWLNHSLRPIDIHQPDFLTTVGIGEAAYDISLLNISGTSFGALSPPAIQALNTGASLGRFAHNTGEGSLSKYHQAGGGDLIWQISTGYFGCRDEKGNFDPELFKSKASLPQVKMIEIKLSQGAKPGHGGMLLGGKVTDEIAETRRIPVGEDCISPAFHSMFSTPTELLDFAEQLRCDSGGKPVGIKLCIGHPWEFIAIVKAMVTEKRFVDFVTVDGSEGGTGAAPAEFTDHLGCPLADALVFVDNCLIGAGIRDRVKVAASGKIVSAYDIVRHCALGADWINMARPFMFALGCIQARDCASGRCPTGIATMDPGRYRVVDVAQKAQRVANFHHNTLKVVGEMIGAAGISHPVHLTRRHIVRRLSSSEIRLADQIFPHVEPGALFTGEPIEDPRLDVYWNKVSGDSFNFEGQPPG